MNLLRLLFGTLCRDCDRRHRSDVCPRCFHRRLAQLERCDSRVIAHPEQDWEKRVATMKKNRENLGWNEVADGFVQVQDRRKKSRLRAVR